jgi:hypothetical protein
LPIGVARNGTLLVDGKVISTETMGRTIPLTLPWDETFDIGSDTGTRVDDTEYQVPFAFTGRIDKLTSLAPPVLSEDGKRKLMEADRARQRPTEARNRAFGTVRRRDASLPVILARGRIGFRVHHRRCREALGFGMYRGVCP